jgi:hypothetical protein
MEEIFEFFHKMAPLAQGVGQKWFFYHNFKSIQLFLNLFLEHIFKKMGSTEIVVSSVRPSVCCFTVVNSTVWDF